MRNATAVLLAVILIVPASALPAGFALAQGWQSSVAPQSATSAKQASPPPGVAAPPRAKAAPVRQKQSGEQPLPIQTQYLVRTTLLALNNANQTGNYTVLRDLAAPSFRERNSAADLAQVFGELRRAKLDLSMAALLMPEIEETPSLDADRRLRLKGSYATQPNRVVFDILYEAVAGEWQLFGLSISTRPMRAASGGVPSGGPLTTPR